MHTERPTRSAAGHVVRRQHPRLSGRAWAAATLLAAALGVVGCSSLLPKPSPQPAFYGLQAPLRPAAAGRDDVTARPAAAGREGMQPRPAAARVLVVQMPVAASGFDSARIVYTQQPNRLQIYARHEWIDTPARMLAPLLVTALERSGAFDAVVLAPSAALGTLQLDTQLLRLQQEFAAPPSRVRLVLRAQLIHPGSRQVLATKEFEQSAVSPSEDAPGGVAATQQAVDALLSELALWCEGVVKSTR